MPPTTRTEPPISEKLNILRNHLGGLTILIESNQALLLALCGEADLDPEAILTSFLAERKNNGPLMNVAPIPDIDIVNLTPPKGPKN